MGTFLQLLEASSFHGNFLPISLDPHLAMVTPPCHGTPPYQGTHTLPCGLHLCIGDPHLAVVDPCPSLRTLPPASPPDRLPELPEPFQGTFLPTLRDTILGGWMRGVPERGQSPLGSMERSSGCPCTSPGMGWELS